MRGCTKSIVVEQYALTKAICVSGTRGNTCSGAKHFLLRAKSTFRESYNASCSKTNVYLLSRRINSNKFSAKVLETRLLAFVFVFYCCCGKQARLC